MPIMPCFAKSNKKRQVFNPIFISVCQTSITVRFFPFFSTFCREFLAFFFRKRDVSAFCPKIFYQPLPSSSFDS